jgi:phosphoadenosine phosphosulfate reductase
MSPDYILWCNKCKIPYRDPDERCNICNEIGKEIARDLRPVFARERAILEYFGHKVMNKSVWTSSRSRIYYVDGKKIKLPKWENYRDEAENIRNYILQRETELQKYDYKVLEQYYYEIQASYHHLKILENESFDFVNDVVKKYNRRMIMVSFSGGKDSTVVSDIVRRALGNDNILHVFGDTKLEDENTYRYIEEFQMMYPNVPFFTGQSEQDFHDLVDHMGPPSRVMRWCCTIIKAGPINNFLQSLGDKVRVLTFYGVRHAESTQRADYNAVTVGAKIGTQVTASPIIDWLEFDVWGYIFQNEVHFNKSYRLGYSRVGCWLCPLNSTWSDFLNSIHFKEDNDQWQNYLIDFAKKIGKPDPEVYVKERKWAARHGGAGLANRWLGIDIKPCGDMDNTIEINLTKSINQDFLEFIKPLGKLDVNRSDPEKGIYFTKKNGNAGHNMLIRAITGDTMVRVTALDPNESDNVHRFAKYQFNKFQTCIQCTACSVACPHSAILVRPEHDVYEIDEEKCVNCNECVTHFGSTGCLVAKSLSSYGKDKKDNFLQEKKNSKDGLPNIILLDVIEKAKDY